MSLCTHMSLFRNIIVHRCSNFEVTRLDKFRCPIADIHPRSISSSQTHVPDNNELELVLNNKHKMVGSLQKSCTTL